MSRRRPLFSAELRDRVRSIAVAGAALWGVSIVPRIVAALERGMEPVPAALVTVPPLVYWLSTVPLIVLLAARFPIRFRSHVGSIPAHMLFALVFAGAYAHGMVWLLVDVLQVDGRWTVDRQEHTATRFQFGLLSYAFILAWSQIHEYLAQLRERDVAAARLQAELAQAQLRALKAQLSPHFLFNTLHAITVLIRRDADEATRMVMRLSDMLRLTVADGGRQEAPLADEVRFTKLYLEIEQTRFRERLDVRWEVAPEAERALVPTLVLQTLVENAIKHAVEPRPAGGRVAIRAGREGDALALSVEDDGPGPDARPARPGEGIGLSATRGRLAELYGDGERLRLEPAPGGGMRALVRVPWREAGAHA